MTYQSDPARWTQAHLDSSDDGPSDLLRDAFAAGVQEGPSDLQMRTLALKMAALGTGATLAAGASAAHATAAGGAGAGGAVAALKSGTAFTLGKIAASVALVGAVAASAVVFQQSITQPAVHSTADVAVQSSHVERAMVPQADAPQVQDQVTPAVVPARSVEAAAPVKAPIAASAKPSQLERAVAEPASETVVVESNKAEESAVVAPKHHAVRVERHVAQPAVSQAVAPAAPAAPAKIVAPHVTAERVAGQRQQVSEIELLRSARAQLAAHPREAYRLAEEHKALFPQGVFAQERDALAVEAAQRAGESKLARQLAESFVKRYPSSPHAHRFRETMNLQ